MSELIQRESTEIQAVDNNPARFIEMAITQNADIDKLEKLMALQERYEANLAKKAFVAAMTKFQQNCPVIKKAKQGHNGKYAPLEDIVRQIKELMSKCGISYRFEQRNVDASIEVTCIATHCDGHSESSFMSSCPDSSGGKNVIQSSASAVTYLRRYTFTSVFGITTADEDQDGRLIGDIDYEKLAGQWKSAYEKLVAHNAVIREFYEEIYIIKEKLSNGDVLGAKTDLSECMSSEQKDLLFRSEANGAIVSSKEKTAMKNYSTEERNAA